MFPFLGFGDTPSCATALVFLGRHPMLRVLGIGDRPPYEL